MMKAASLILLTFISFQSFSQTFPDTAILKQFIERWNVANNYKYTAWQSEQYTSTLLFYGETVDKSKAIAIKIAFFKKHTSYQQEIVSPIRFSFYKSGVVKCSFDKKVYYGSSTKDYPAYLLFIKQNDVYKISGESDLISDSNTGFKLDLGEEIDPNRSNYIWYLVFATVIIIAIVLLLLRGKKKKLKDEGSKEPKKRLAVFVANVNPDKNVFKEKGDDFEKYVVKLFKQKTQFQLNEWRGDKYIDGIYAESTLNPDLELTYQDNTHSICFAVECKYRSYLSNMVVICKEHQLQNYKSFQEKRNIPVFIVLGTGGSASAPKEMFIIPLSALPQHEVAKNIIQSYKRRSVSSAFYLDINTKMLS